MHPPLSSRRAVLAALGTGLVALVWRGTLTRMYWGSEEEDYGNLGLIIGTLQSGFTFIETEHMPLYTTLSALFTAAVGEPELGGELLAVLAGSVSVGLTTWMGWRWLSPATGVAAGLLLAFHPDSALTAATPLRISTFVALSLLAVALLGQQRPIAGALALSAAFLTRFDAAFSLLPALLLLAAVRRDRRTVAAAGLVVGTVVLWALYYNHELGTYAFWGAVADRNSGSDGGGVGTLALFCVRVLPEHLGHVLVVAAPAGLVLALRSPAPADASASRWLALCGAGVFGFLCLAIVVGNNRWDHNLFWKWLCGSAPYVALFGAFAVEQLLRWVARTAGRSGKPLVLLLAAALLVPTALTYTQQVRGQLEVSDRMYGTQVRLADWADSSLPDEAAILADLIPATYLSRKPESRRVLRWTDRLEDGTSLVPGGLSPAQFGAFLVDESVALVITFEEEWVGSAERVPWLSGLAPVQAGPVLLTPVALETSYGFVAWGVTGAGVPEPRTPPPVDAGAVRVVVVPSERQAVPP